MGLGFGEKYKFETRQELRAVMTFGPKIFYPTGTETSCKLFKFCKVNFTDLSTRALRNSFMRGCILVNERQVPANHESETIRLREGDSVSIEICWEDHVRDSEKFHELNLVVENDKYAIIEKPPGEDISRYSLFGVIYRLKLWMGDSFDLALPVYEIPRAHSGLIIIVRNPTDAYSSVVNMFIQSILTLSLTALICMPELATFSDSVELFSNKNEEEPKLSITNSSYSAEFSSFSMTSLRTTPSRSRDALSLIEVDLDFRKDMISATSNPSNWISQALQTVGHHLAHQLSLPVVGHGKTMNTQHGVFMTWNKISLIENVEKVIYEMPLPPKFHKFLDTEERLYWKAVTATECSKEELRTRLVQHEDQLRSIEALSGVSIGSVDNASVLESKTVTLNDENSCIFCDMVFRISSDVMHPRISSETVVNVANEYISREIKNGHLRTGFHVVDIGTGSGNLLLSVLFKLANNTEDITDRFPLRGVGLDLSTAALEIAAWNRNSLLPIMQQQIQSIVEVDFMTGNFSVAEDIVSAFYHRMFDNSPIHLILCNPPYSSHREQRISESVKRRDPSMALFAHEDDPLWAYRQLLRTLSDRRILARCIPNHTLIVFEIGHGQAERIRRIFENSVWLYLETRRDHKELQRVMVFSFTNSNAVSEKEKEVNERLLDK